MNVKKNSIQLGSSLLHSSNSFAQPLFVIKTFMLCICMAHCLFFGQSWRIALNSVFFLAAMTPPSNRGPVGHVEMLILANPLGKMHIFFLDQYIYIYIFYWPKKYNIFIFKKKNLMRYFKEIFRWKERFLYLWQKKYLVQKNPLF